ncbi:MAG TPA: sulfotransferase [Allosphingosinicella sp.]|jgi:hypothetical protein
MTGLAVVGVGLPRTGTFSLRLALERIGFAPCHHMLDLIDAPNRAWPWIAALDGDKIILADALAGYQAAVDLPACLLIEDILQQFPETYAVLTHRDPASWADSMEVTLMSGGEADPGLTRLVAQCFERLFGTCTPTRDQLVEGYLRHVSSVRAIVPPQQLLVFRVEEGWGPLCRFLSCSLPRMPFPHTNSRDTFSREATSR